MNIPDKWINNDLEDSRYTNHKLLAKKDNQIIDCLHDLTTRVEKLEPKDERFTEPRTLPRCTVCGANVFFRDGKTVFSCDCNKPASQPEQRTCRNCGHTKCRYCYCCQWMPLPQHPDHIVDTNKKVEPGKEEWMELWDNAKEYLKNYLTTPITTYMKSKEERQFNIQAHILSGIYDRAMTAAAKKIEEQQKELERVKDGVSRIIFAMKNSHDHYYNDVISDLEELIKGDK